MSSKIEDRHAAVKSLHDIMQAVPCNSLYSLAEAVLDAGYAAPVVERKPMPIYQVRYLGDGGAGWSDVEKDELDQLKPRKDYHTRTVFDAPPELAELQATIAQLQAELEHIGHDHDLLRNENAQLKSEIERLKGGQGEPVAYFDLKELERLKMNKSGYVSIIAYRERGALVSPLFASQPAPVSVVPEPFAWYTEDYLTDKSATTYDLATAERWKAKGWPVQSLHILAAVAPGCKTCGGTRLVDDGELTCSAGGIPYENGPIKVMKDCPDCASQPASVSVCTSCDGSGEYIDAIGDWRGYCSCPAGVELENKAQGSKP